MSVRQEKTIFLENGDIVRSDGDLYRVFGNINEFDSYPHLASFDCISLITGEWEHFYAHRDLKWTVVNMPDTDVRMRDWWAD